MIAIVDYGLGNLGSIANMLRRLGVDGSVTRDPGVIIEADQLILPGVGAFDNGMSNLRNLGLLDVLNARVLDAKVPVLGICLGAQLMTAGSEEGQEKGLGWIDADTVKFKTDATKKIPHMGWSDVHPKKANPLVGLEEESRFYFVHSYHFACRHSDDILGTASYGYEFTAAFSRGNVFGVQFHPEKSHRFGMALLTRFAGLAK